MRDLAWVERALTVIIDEIKRSKHDRLLGTLLSGAHFRTITIAYARQMRSGCQRSRLQAGDWLEWRERHTGNG